MFRALVAAAIAAFFIAAPSSAAECESPNATVQMVFDRVPSAQIMDTLTSTEIAAVIRGYNAIEPVSEYAADGLIVMAAPNFASVLLIATQGPCVVFRTRFRCRSS